MATSPIQSIGRTSDHQIQNQSKVRGSKKRTVDQMTGNKFEEKKSGLPPSYDYDVEMKSASKNRPSSMSQPHPEVQLEQN